MTTRDSNPLTYSFIRIKPDYGVHWTSCSLLKDFQRIIVFNSVSYNNVMVAIVGPLLIFLREKSILCGPSCLCVSDRRVVTLKFDNSIIMFCPNNVFLYLKCNMMMSIFYSIQQKINLTSQ